MAQITEMPSGFMPVWIHDVTHPVSWKWFCYRDDVMLLQYALNQIMAKVKLQDMTKHRRGPLGDYPASFGPGGREYLQIEPLEVDGIFGPKSHAALVSYQQSDVCGNHCIKTDGDLDPVYKYISELGSDPIAPGNMMIMTKVTSFTMFKINRDILTLYGKLMNEEDMPKELKDTIRARPYWKPGGRR
jgi:hypothetical protein